MMKKAAHTRTTDKTRQATALANDSAWIDPLLLKKPGASSSVSDQAHRRVAAP